MPVEPEPPAVPSVWCRGLRRTFGDREVLSGVSLDAHPGDVVALLGPNGAGKTTTVRILNGLLAPHGGEVRVLGLDPVTDGHAVRSRTGVVTEHAGVDPRLTPREHLRFVATVRGVPRPEGVIDRLIDLLGLGALADHRTAGFSTGERRRVALAASLVGDPELLLLDEPTSGLDPAAAGEVVDLIGALARDRGRTIILCTHLLAEADRLATRVAIMRDGRTVLSGARDELAKGASACEITTLTPPGPEVAGLLAALPGVSAPAATPSGVTCRVTDGEATARAVATLVAAGIGVTGVRTRRPTLEDLYFEVHPRRSPVPGTRPAPAGVSGA